MSRIPVPTHSPSHPRTLQEPVSFPPERAVSPAPSSRHNSVHSAPMSSLSGHASSPGAKKLSKRALGDEVNIGVFFSSRGRCLKASHFACEPWPFSGLISNNRLCAKELSTSSLVSALYQPLSKVAADAEANPMLLKAPLPHSSPALRLQFQIPFPSRKQVSSVQQRGQTAFLLSTTRRV